MNLEKRLWNKTSHKQGSPINKDLRRGHLSKTSPENHGPPLIEETERRRRTKRGNNSHTGYREKNLGKVGESEVAHISRKCNTPNLPPLILPNPSTLRRKSRKRTNRASTDAKNETPFCDKQPAQVPPVRYLYFGQCACSLPKFPAVMRTFCRRFLERPTSKQQQKIPKCK